MPLRRGPAYHADQATVRRRHERSLEPLPVEPLQERAERSVRTNGARPFGHRLRHRDRLVPGERTPAEPPEHDALLVDDDALIPVTRADSFAYLPQVISEQARGNVVLNYLPGRRL